MSSAELAVILFYTFIFPILLIIAVAVIAAVVKRLFKDDDTKTNNEKEPRDKTLPTLHADESQETVRIKPESIGKVGEMIIKTALGKKYQLPSKYILSNVLIPTKDGGTTEIDVIAVTSRGVLLFECKNLTGSLYGDARSKKWIQYVGKKKYTFANPFHQNYGHLKALETLLGEKYKDVPIYCFFVPTERGKWHFRNLDETDYVLGRNISLQDFMRKTPVSEAANSSAGTLVEFLGGFQASEFAMEMHKKYVATKRRYH